MISTAAKLALVQASMDHRDAEHVAFVAVARDGREGLRVMPLADAQAVATDERMRGLLATPGEGLLVLLYLASHDRFHAFRFAA